MRPIILLGVFAVCVLALTTAKAESADATVRKLNETSIQEGIAYSRADEALKLSLYLPQASARAVPCIIVIQGGGFSGQDGKRFRPFAQHLADNGFAAALIAYRGRPDHTFETTMADARAAVRFVRSVSSEYGIDPSRIGAMGRSAGATIAVLLAVTGSDEHSGTDDAHSTFSSHLEAAVGISGVYDFVARFTSEEQMSIQPELASKIESNGEWIGTPFSPTDKRWLDASAINRLDAADPPVLLIHSKNDRTVPWMQSRDMHAAMTKAGIPSEIQLSETGGHGGPENAMDLMVTFFRNVLVEQDSVDPSAAFRRLLSNEERSF